ncbi:hypothetical protein [Polynucleobacter sp. AP-Feld-500C-C5]|uniref:hypothetical protein n=1 Tax=Polynucleobacter sp. AP-Feld-500C-C5 TaxID=2576924 RepID=UPI001C0BBF88|nr:hypothetical protein [Polynucleobacter sp. AP-Feld-500C-C5]MBU3633163.1 acyl carrier protein [Polynucleobacter sp. AP-Feld-500C-C5]
MINSDEILKILMDLHPEFNYAQSSNWIKEGLLDSLDIVMLVSQLENKFSLKIPGEKIRAENFINLPTMISVFFKDS